MTRARNIAGFSTITTTPSPVHVGPIGVLTATRIDGEFNLVDLDTRDITAQGIGVTNLQVSGITTGLNVSGIITAQNGINFNGTSTGLNVSGVGTIATLNVSGNATIGGVLTYEDVTNVDSVGVVTARGLNIFGNTTGLNAGISTFTGDVTLTNSNHVTQVLKAGGSTSDLAIDFKDSSNNVEARILCASDQGDLRFYTGGTNERLRINSTGNVGLGVADPNILNEPAKFQELTLGGKTEGAAIHLKDDNGNVSAGMFTSDATGALILRTITNHPILIRTNNNEKIRITNTGLIGIGTDNPTSGAAGARVNISFKDETTYNSTTNRANGLIVYNSASGGYSSLELAQRTTSGNTYGSAIINAVDPSDGNTYGADLTFQTRATGSGNYGERMRITASGQVGIATVIPRANFILDVNGDASFGESSGTDNTYLDQKQNGDFHIINSGRDSNGVSGSMTGGAGGVGINRYNTIAGGTSQFRDFVVYDGKSTKVLMVDGSSGEVGIGTDNPTGAFEVNWNGSSTDMIMLSRPETGGNFARLGHNTASGTNMLDVRSEGHIRFLTNGNNERVRFDSGGRVLIATTTEGFGTYGEELTIGSPGGDHAGMTIRSGNGHKGTIYFSDGTSGDAEYRGSVQYDHADDSLRLAASTTNQLFIQSNIIDYFNHRNIYQRNQNIAITDGGNKQFTISGLGYGFAKLQVAGYGEGQFFNVEVTIGGLMASGSQYYSATIIANGSSGSCDVNFGANQTTYVVTISNNVGNGGSIHCTSLFTGSGNSAHPNLAVS